MISINLLHDLMVNVFKGHQQHFPLHLLVCIAMLWLVQVDGLARREVADEPPFPISSGHAFSGIQSTI